MKTILPRQSKRRVPRKLLLQKHSNSSRPLKFPKPLFILPSNSPLFINHHSKAPLISLFQFRQISIPPRKCRQSPKSPSWPPTPIASACFRSTILRSGRCTRRPRPPSGRRRRSICRRISATGNPSPLTRSISSNTF